MNVWQERAEQAAEVSYKDYQYRYKVLALPLPSDHVLLLNNLFAPALPLTRDRQQAELSRRLNLLGIATLATATAPRTGPSEGVSSAMVFDAPRSMKKRIEQEFLEVYATFQPAWEE